MFAAWHAVRATDVSHSPSMTDRSKRSAIEDLVHHLTNLPGGNWMPLDRQVRWKLYERAVSARPRPPATARSQLGLSKTMSPSCRDFRPLELPPRARLKLERKKE